MSSRDGGGDSNHMEKQGRAIALGFFDGVHIGHGALMKRTLEVAEEIHAEPSVLSFDVHPDTLVFGREVLLLNNNFDRKDIIHRLYGIDDVIFIHFDKEVMHMPWKKFVDNLIAELDARWLVVGHDFTFGDRGEGNAERLKGYCAEIGIGCDIIPAVKKDGLVVSSTYIRDLIEAGDIERANEFLGHPHCLTDTVHTGYQLGTKMGTPTINMLVPRGVMIPRHGVYTAQVILDDGSRHPAVTNIGVRPTVSETNTVSVETYILDFSENLYDRRVRVELFRHLRDEKKFADYSELSQQIQKDAEEARHFFEENNV